MDASFITGHDLRAPCPAGECLFTGGMNSGAGIGFLQ
jgi:hypothetical protein